MDPYKMSVCFGEQSPDSPDMACFSLEDYQLEQAKSADTQQIARLDLMCRMTEMLASIGRSSELYERSLKLLFNVFQKAERGVMFLVESDGKGVLLDPPAAVFNRNESKKEVKLPISKTIIKKCVKERTCILIKNAMADEQLMTMSIMENKIHSVLASPMFHENRFKGVIVVESSSSSAFNEEDQRLLMAVSNQLGLAMDAFDNLQQKLEGDKIRQQLERYTTPQLAEKIQAGEHNIALGGEKTEGVVLFSDLVGFTSMSERMPPEKIVERLNMILKGMVACIFKYKGAVDKFGGDSIMAHWNILADINAPEVHAIKTALAMQNHLFLFGLSYIGKEEGYIRMGIGINSGEVVAGNIGTDTRMDYTVIGETVNLASRLESKAGGNCVFISPKIYDTLKQNLLTLKLKDTSFKNVSKPIPVYSVRGIKIKDGYMTSIPLLAKTKEGLMEAKLTLLHEEVAYMESDFKLKLGREVVLNIWLPELPSDQEYKHGFKILRVDTLIEKPKPLYKTKMLMGKGFLKELLQKKILSTNLSGDDVPRKPILP
jgi:class 3 adenylate cyclase